jgi:hypothetical protein
MQKVESLIFERLQQLHQESDGHAEREVINDALSIAGHQAGETGFPRLEVSDNLRFRRRLSLQPVG